MQRKMLSGPAAIDARLSRRDRSADVGLHGFNVHAEPIANRPAECVRTLLDGRIDFGVTQDAVYARSRH